MLKKLFSLFGYTLSRPHKSISMDEIIKLRLRYLPTDILLDIGANKGVFTKCFRDEFKDFHLFEPNPDLVRSLKNQFKTNNYKIIKFGTGDINEKVLLNITNDNGSSLSSIKKQTVELKNNFRNTNIVKKVEVEIKRLDHYLNKIELNDKKIFLKIDTQGNDFETLIGLGKYIRNVSFIKIEMPCINLYNSSYNHWDILDYLQNYNFKPVYFENISRTKKGQLIEYDCFFEKNNI
jgi:FkbM family methyltransferase